MQFSFVIGAVGIPLFAAHQLSWHLLAATSLLLGVASAVFSYHCFKVSTRAAQDASLTHVMEDEKGDMGTHILRPALPMSLHFLLPFLSCIIGSILLTPLIGSLYLLPFSTHPFQRHGIMSGLAALFCSLSFIILVLGFSIHSPFVAALGGLLSAVTLLWFVFKLHLFGMWCKDLVEQTMYTN
jgi:hypothetical protein